LARLAHMTVIQGREPVRLAPLAQCKVRIVITNVLFDSFVL